MKKQKVNSREYKVMLYPKHFKGDQAALCNSAQAFWDDFSEAIKDIVTITDDRLDDLAKRRKVRFYDTKNHKLNAASYVFRERIEIEEDKDGMREVTLKFRHRDRYVSQARDMRDKDGDDDNLKFEEDIKPHPFVSLYSFSNKRKVKKSKKLKKLNDPARLFPDLKKQLQHQYHEAYDGNTKIDIVNKFTAYEIVIEGASFEIDKGAELQCQCALIVWYREAFTEKPIVAEFSFKYKDETKKERFSRKAAERAYTVFQILQGAKLKKWVNVEGSTKTAFVYSDKACK